MALKFVLYNLCLLLVAVAFWRAMGGDEEEIEGLDSD